MSDRPKCLRGGTHASSTQQAEQNVRRDISMDRMQAVLSGNFDALHDTDNAFPGVLKWVPTQVELNWKDHSYLIGTDGGDEFDTSYCSRYNFFHSALLVNLLAEKRQDGNLMGYR